MSEVVKGNMKDILDAIQEIQDKNVYPVYIPSLKKNVMFKEMSTKQEKSLVKTIVDSPIYNSEFIFAIREIVKENCAEEIDVDTLTIIDKTAICLTMRMKSIGDEFDYVFKNTEKTKTIKISDYVDKFKGVKIPKNEVVGTDDVKIECSYPTVLTEYQLEKEFRSNSQNLEIKTTDEARNALGCVFSNELAKYIKTITIKKGDTDMVLDMADYNFSNRIDIIESIGNKATNLVIDYIDKSNSEVREKLKVELELSEDDVKLYKTKKLSSMLETNSDFFITS